MIPPQVIVEKLYQTECQTEHTDSIFKEIDIEGDGRINFQEFQTIMQLKSDKKASEKRFTDAELRAVFRVFDDDCRGDQGRRNEGNVSREELPDVSMKGRGNFTNEDLEQTFDEANVDGDDTVNYEELKKITMKASRNEKNSKTEWCFDIIRGLLVNFVVDQ